MGNAMTRRIAEPHRMKPITVPVFLSTVLSPLLARAQECGSVWTHVMRYYPGTQAFYAVVSHGT